MKPKLIKAFGALPPHDARYKALKQGGYITKKQHRKNYNQYLFLTFSSNSNKGTTNLTPFDDLAILIA